MKDLQFFSDLRVWATETQVYRMHSRNHQAQLPQSIKGVLARVIYGTLHALFLRNDRNEWELPGGRPEPGESPDQTLTREFLEETGLHVTVGPRIHSGVLTILPPFVAQITRVSISAFGCRLKDSHDTPPAIQLSDEHRGERWIPIDELAGMNDVPEIYKTAVFHWKRELGE